MVSLWMELLVSDSILILAHKRLIGVIPCVRGKGSVSVMAEHISTV